MAGIEPFVLAPEVDETAVADAAGGLGPEDLVQLLASAKASAVSERSSTGRLAPAGESTAAEAHRASAASELILGCDSAFELDGVVYGKPHHAVVAAARWRDMRGRTGILHTGHCLVDQATGDRGTEVVSTEVTFADVSDAEIEWYVGTGEPLQVAGAFTLEGLAAPFISGVTRDVAPFG
jgi:septum formation protein